MIASTSITAKQFAALPDEPCRRDLIEGEVWTMPAAGSEHGNIASRIDRLIGAFVDLHGLGETFGAETGFQLARDPDTVLAPAMAFVRADRIPASGIPVDYWEIAPDLVVEIVSSSDRPAKVATKVATYLRAGVLVVWVLYPRPREVVIHGPSAEPRTLGQDDILDGGAVLPGFTCPVRNLWPHTPRQ
jgi:Uma2 family endonuclease